MRFLGPPYDIEASGVRVRDVDLACPTCGHRLAEVISDVTGCWTRGRLACIDCWEIVRKPVGEKPVHRTRVVPSRRATGMFLAGCSCGWYSQILSKSNATALAMGHAA